MRMPETVLKIRADTSEFLEAIDNLPDEILDRLADKLVDRIEKRLRQKSRLRG